MACYICENPNKETRPYGELGQPICFDCMKASPEREAAATAIFTSLLKAAGPVVLLDPEHGPLLYKKDGLS